jgi:Kef-type K+ transport system membrane component KefB
LRATGRWGRLSDVVVRLQDTTAQIRVRGAVLLLVGFAYLASRFGLETILGAFLAGAILGLVDRDATMDHPNFRLKLEGMGFGFLVPVFFISSGVRFDLQALFASASSLSLIPLFLLALLVVRGIPALVYRQGIGSRGAVAAGLLQATSLPFLVTATSIGVSLGAMTVATAAALVATGLLSVLVFPLAALIVLRSGAEDDAAHASARVNSDAEHGGVAQR